MMEIAQLEIPDVLLLTPAQHKDERGLFVETWNRALFAQSGFDVSFVQDNHSLSRRRGTVRGLHFQIPPLAQAKLVRVVAGSALDVAVDIRKGSPTYGRHVSARLSADNWRQMLIPEGFAHGLCTLEPDTAVLYKVTAPYSREHDKGIAWNDPALGIDWSVSDADAVVSDRDKNLPPLADLPDYFSA